MAPAGRSASILLLRRVTRSTIVPDDTKMRAHYGSYPELCKIRVAGLSAFSAATGFLLAAPELSARILTIVAGVFMVVCGSLALNQYQERTIDAAMPRTRTRPLPSGRMKPADALYLSSFLLVFGFSILSLAGNFLVCMLGLFALVWYNGTYTYLKRITAFAAIPGAMIGAIPPAIGWIAGGGEPQDPRLIALCCFFLVWQIPHSWLFIMHCGHEYEKAGIPSLTSIFQPLQMQRIVFAWICALTVTGFALSAVRLVHYLPIRIMLLILPLWLAWSGVNHLLVARESSGSLSVFKNTGYYLAAVLFFLSVDRLFLLG
jgi:protoheme IX farnesyltransferase